MIFVGSVVGGGWLLFMVLVVGDEGFVLKVGWWFLIVGGDGCVVGGDGCLREG